VKLGRKLQKLITGDAFASAVRHTRDAYPRRPLALDAARITRTVQAEKFAEIRQRHAVPGPTDGWPKYLDLERWMRINLQRVREVGLDLGRRKRILDLGCGTGYFLYICQYFGHEVLGLDIDITPAFAEMVALLAIPRVIWQVAPFVPLPDLGGKFDVITAHMICFNGHKSEQLWGIREWQFFLDDLAQHLKPRGLIALELNREDDGTHYTPELKAYFESRGAELHTQRVRFSRLRRAPGAGARALAGFRTCFAPMTRPTA
jgi:SAM-dependent methyltransferase